MLLKVVMIGDTGAGKTSLLIRYSDQTFSPSYQSTLCLDFKIRNIQVDRFPVKLQIWDTAGQERFQGISQAYYRKTHACIAVYDVTSLQSFKNLEAQIIKYLKVRYEEDENEDVDKDLDQSENVSYRKVELPVHNIVLVGTKVDLV